MIIKANGRSALILAAGFFVYCAGPSHAATSADSAATSSKFHNAVPVKHVWHHGKTYVHHRYAKAAPKPAAAATDDVADADKNSTVLPPSVANANAELTTADVPGGSAKAMSTRANDLLQATPSNATATAGTEVVAADQINEVDRALQDNPQPAAPVTVASADPPAAPVAPVTAGNNDNSTWDQTSLIGKIFIAFGGLLTLASAARMFMA